MAVLNDCTNEELLVKKLLFEICELFDRYSYFSRTVLAPSPFSHTHIETDVIRSRL